MKFVVLVVVVGWVSSVAAEPAPTKGHVPRVGVGASMTLVSNEYEQTLWSIELAGRIVRNTWLELGLGTGEVEEHPGGSPAVYEQSLYEGRAGISHVLCFRYACGGARASIGYMRHAQLEGELIISPYDWERRRHHWFGDLRLLGRLDIASWAALEVALGIRQSYATVHRFTAESTFGTVAAISFYVTL
jgi:hypothetical protein